MNDYNFANKIMRLRTQINLSQVELAQVVDVTNKAVSKWENQNQRRIQSENYQHFLRLTLTSYCQ